MFKIVFYVSVLLSASVSLAKIEVLSSGILYQDDAKAYNPIDHGEWYAISTSDKVTKLKLKLGPVTEDHSPAPAHDIIGEKNALFYIRGINLKEGQFTKNNSTCSIAFIPKHSPSKKGPANSEWNLELFVKCNSKSYYVTNFKMKTGDQTPSVNWSADINGDGFPEIRVNYDPWEKSFPDQIYFSEKTESGIKYIFAGRLQYQSC